MLAIFKWLLAIEPRRNGLADPKLGLPRSGRPSRKLEAGPDPVPERLMHRYVNRSTPREQTAVIETPNSIFVAIIEASTGQWPSLKLRVTRS